MKHFSSPIIIQYMYNMTNMYVNANWHTHTRNFHMIWYDTKMEISIGVEISLWCERRAVRIRMVQIEFAWVVMTVCIFDMYMYKNYAKYRWVSSLIALFDCGWFYSSKTLNNNNEQENELSCFVSLRAGPGYQLGMKPPFLRDTDFVATFSSTVASVWFVHCRNLNKWNLGDW